MDDGTCTGFRTKPFKFKFELNLSLEAVTRMATGPQNFAGAIRGHTWLLHTSYPGLPRATSRLFAELLGGLRTGFLVVYRLRIACVFLQWERGRSSKRVWHSQCPSGVRRGPGLAFFSPNNSFIFISSGLHTHELS
jgi:hypothetical protein